jgi:DNA-binding LytR/AlgR family response regulator
MKPLSCLIIEDLEADAQLLMQMLSELPVAFKADWCQLPTDVLNRMQQSAYDLVFLDIRLPGLLGTDLLRDMPYRPPVIVVTAYTEYAVDGYDLDVADFLLKPYGRSRLLRAVNRALNRGDNLMSHNLHLQDSIFLQANRRLQQFKFTDILYVEAQGIHAKIHRRQDATVVSHSISCLENQLPTAQFMRVQKSFIVNVQHITAVDARSLWIGLIKISVGARYREPLKQFLLGLNGTNSDLQSPNPDSGPETE